MAFLQTLGGFLRVMLKFRLKKNSEGVFLGLERVEAPEGMGELILAWRIQLGTLIPNLQLIAGLEVCHYQLGLWISKQVGRLFAKM